MRGIIFNPVFKYHKSKTGAVHESEEFDLIIKITEHFNISNLRLYIFNDDNVQIRYLLCKQVEYDDDYNIFKVHVNKLQVGLYWYYFKFDDCYGSHFICPNESLDAVLVDSSPSSWQITVYGDYLGSLDEYKGGIIYQIMVDRFFNGDKSKKDLKDGTYLHDNWEDIPNYRPINGRYCTDFYGGDLRGVIEKLDYLKSLNVNIIYLNPIFRAFSNHKYDIANYREIDPMFGDNETFSELIDEANKRNIKIILDGVFNHTGDDSIYFNKYKTYPNIGAYQSKNSIYYNWYRFKKHPNSYDSWWGIKDLPSINQNSSFVDFITGENGIIRHWLKKGVSGFRLDVVDELMPEFVEKISNALKMEDNQNFLIGEVWEDASNKISYNLRRSYFNGRQLDSVMNYPLKKAIITYLKDGNVSEIKDVMRRTINNYPKHVCDLLMNILGTHDTFRFINNFTNNDGYLLAKDRQSVYKLTADEYKRGKQKLKMAAIMQFTLPGIPCIYYGDEAGLDGFSDPFCRKTYPWGKEDTELIDWYMRLSAIRNNDVYKYGEYQEITAIDNIYAYARVLDDKKIITIINNSDCDINWYFHENNYDILNDILLDNEVEIEKQTGRIIMVNKVQ